MHKTIITLFALLFITVQAQAAEVFHETTLADGSKIRLCSDNNGGWNYCSPQDAMNSMRAFNNHNLYTPETKQKNAQMIQQGNYQFWTQPQNWQQQPNYVLVEQPTQQVQQVQPVQQVQQPYYYQQTQQIQQPVQYYPQPTQYYPQQVSNQYQQPSNLQTVANGLNNTINTVNSVMNSVRTLKSTFSY